MEGRCFTLGTFLETHRHGKKSSACPRTKPVNVGNVRGGGGGTGIFYETEDRGFRYDGGKIVCT